jgi:cytochrome c oxidase assembly protein subunit 11
MSAFNAPHAPMTDPVEVSRVEAEWEKADRRQAAARKKNIRLVTILFVIGFGMLGFAYANVPLYNMLCAKLGIGLNPNNEALLVTEPSDRVVEFIFSGQITGDLPVTITPSKRIIRARLGEPVVNDFHVVNMASRKVYFRPIHTINPAAVADDKIRLAECFCFDDQMLHERQSVSYPLVFVASTDIPDDVRTVRMHYTLMPITADRYDPTRTNPKHENLVPVEEGS